MRSRSASVKIENRSESFRMESAGLGTEVP